MSTIANPVANTTQRARSLLGRVPLHGRLPLGWRGDHLGQRLVAHFTLNNCPARRMEPKL
jgi:hypothetical protein